MRPTRRQFIKGVGLLGAAVGGGASRSTQARVIQSRSVDRLLPGAPTVEGAGVHLARVIGQPALRHLDPFILLDRFHSNNPADYLPGFPDHPHRGFETVTIMLSGHVLHRDSRGNHGDIAGGGAQWMTAGRGIVHSEMPQRAEPPGSWLSGFQLWVNLPAREKMCAPEYQDLTASALGHAKLSAGSGLTVIAGEVNGLRGPVRPRPTVPLLLHAMLEDDRLFSVDVAEGHSAFAFVFQGSVEIGSAAHKTKVPSGSLALLSSGNRIELRAPYERSGVILAAGRPLGEPIVQRGPFVMNTEAEIERAYYDYRTGALGAITH